MPQKDSDNNNIPILPSIPGWLSILIFSLLYLLTARLGLFFVLKPEGIASIWPVSGLAFAVLLLIDDKDRNKYIAAIFAANFLANIAGGNTVITSLGFAAANTAEPLLGRFTFIQIAGRHRGFNNLTEVWGLCASAVLANGLSALLGAAVPALAFGAPYWQTWELWWICDGLGILIVAPFILSWSHFRRTAVPILMVSRLIEVVAMLVLTFAITLSISGKIPIAIRIANLPYALFPLLIWAAIRFNAAGTSALMMIVSYFFITNAISHSGVFPWGESTLLDRLLLTQGFLVIISIVSLVVAAAMSSLRDSQEMLEQDKEAIQESEQRFRSFFETTPDLACIADINGYFRQLNDTWEKTLGYSKRELMQKPFIEFIHPEDVENTLLVIKEKLEKGETVISFHNRYLRKAGGVVWLEWTSRPIMEQGITFAIARDITDRKQMEEQKKELEERLNRAEKMESIGTLAGGVAHDLNNMLGALIGNAEYLKMEMKKTDPLYKMAESIMTSGFKAANVVQDLLTMARRGVVLKELSSLNKIVADQMKSSEIRNLLSLHPHVELETRYAPDLLEINASAIHIERAVTNLVSNALHAMRGGGNLVIRTENRYLETPLMGYEAIPKGEYAVLSVSDTGIGILPEHMQNLFEPFFMRKTLNKGGSGLGLSVIWGAMKDHDGYIDVKSEPGEGTTLSLYFPVMRGESARFVEHDIGEYRGYGERILVVDDEESQCRVADMMLTRLNYVVKTVESGEEALEYLKDHDVDLVLLDMIMEPEIDGYETYRRILEMKKIQKAIIFSGFTKTERVRMAQKLGAGEFFMKPYVMEQLGIAVRKELDRK